MLSTGSLALIPVLVKINVMEPDNSIAVPVLNKTKFGSGFHLIKGKQYWGNRQWLTKLKCAYMPIYHYLLKRLKQIVNIQRLSKLVTNYSWPRNLQKGGSV